MTSSPSFVREPEGNGVAERFIRTLKENLLWVRPFATVAELVEALREFRHRYNEQWLIERHGYRTPAQVRRRLPHARSRRRLRRSTGSPRSRSSGPGSLREGPIGRLTLSQCLRSWENQGASEIAIGTRGPRDRDRLVPASDRPDPTNRWPARVVVATTYREVWTMGERNAPLRSVPRRGTVRHRGRHRPLGTRSIPLAGHDRPGATRPGRLPGPGTGHAPDPGGDPSASRPTPGPRRSTATSPRSPRRCAAPPSPAMRSSASWAGAGWASSTRPGRSGSTAAWR